MLLVVVFTYISCVLLGLGCCLLFVACRWLVRVRCFVLVVCGCALACDIEFCCVSWIVARCCVLLCVVRCSLLVFYGLMCLYLLVEWSFVCWLLFDARCLLFVVVRW